MIDDSIQSVTPTLQQTQNFLTVEQAKAYYESQINMLKRESVRVRDNTNTDATFNGLDVVPEWNNARVINRSSISFVEVPYVFTDGKKLASSLSSDSTNPTQRSAACLLISANSQGAMTSSFMSVTADNDFLVNNGTLSNFTYNSVPTQFKGMEMHYDIRGTFINGWHFKQGKIDGKVQRNRGNATSRDCYRVDACIEWSYYTQMGSYTSPRTTVRDCSYSILIGFCGGWFDYDYYGNNNGGTANNGWGGNVTNEWGASCDETCQEAGAVENIVDHLTQPCLQSVLNALKNREIVYTLKAFNNEKIPNVTLVFQEGVIPGSAQGVTYGSRRNYSITLDYAKLYDATNLFIAQVIIHESVHAYLTYMLTEVHPTWWNDYHLYNITPATPDSADFTTLFKAMATGQNGNDSQHSQMSATYRTYMRDALMSYFGDSSSEFSEICADLAWTGLDYSHLPTADKDRISNRINAELQNKKFGSRSPMGTNTCH